MGTLPTSSSASGAQRGTSRQHGSTVESKFEADRQAFLSSQGFQGRAHRISGRSGDTYVLTGGEGTTRRLLIHGGLSEASEWGMLASKLGGRIAIADRPGCGLSYRIDYTRVDDFRAAAAEWVGEVVDGLGEELVDIIGNSMGGYFAIAFAVEHPERVRRLALVGAPAGLVRQLSLFLRLWGNPISGQIIRRLTPNRPEELRERVMVGLVAHPERLPDEYLQVAFDGLRLPGAADAAYTMLRSATDLRGTRQRLLVGDALADLRVPTLFAWGDRDAFLPPSAGEPFAARMSDARFTVLDDVGHLPQLDDPIQVAAVVNEFLGHAP